MVRLPGVLAVSLVAALALGGPAYAPVFMKFDGVDGESSAKDHKDWIEIQSISFGATSSGRMEGTITTGDDPVAVGMLLPAVQKVREPLDGRVCQPQVAARRLSRGFRRRHGQDLLAAGRGTVARAGKHRAHHLRLQDLARRGHGQEGKRLPAQADRAEVAAQIL